MNIMSNAPVTCLTLNRRQKVWWSDVKQAFKQNKTKFHCFHFITIQVANDYQVYQWIVYGRRFCNLFVVKWKDFWIIKHDRVVRPLLWATYEVILQHPSRAYDDSKNVLPNGIWTQVLSILSHYRYRWTVAAKPLGLTRVRRKLISSQNLTVSDVKQLNWDRFHKQSYANLT